MRDAVGRLAHAFLAAGDDDVGIAEFQRLVAQGDGAKARAANLVDPEGRRLERNARGDRGLARRILPRARGEDLAHDHLGDFSGSTCARRRASVIAIWPSRWAGSVLKAPPSRPMGVRAADTIRISLMDYLVPALAATMFGESRMKTSNDCGLATRAAMDGLIRPACRPGCVLMGTSSFLPLSVRGISGTW